MQRASQTPRNRSAFTDGVGLVAADEGLIDPCLTSATGTQVRRNSEGEVIERRAAGGDPVVYEGEQTVPGSASGPA